MCGEKIEKEINGGYFHWALMEAVENKGYYKNAKTANKYYKELGQEINNLCDTGIVSSKGSKRVSNTCYFKIEDIIKVIKNIPKTIKFQYKLTDVKMTVSNTKNIIGLENKEEKMQEMEKITHHKIETVNHYVGTWNNLRLKMIEKIKEIYTGINKYFASISIIAFLILLMTNATKLSRLYEELIILSSLLILYFSRIFVITFTSTLMFQEALNISYLSSIYNIQYLFGILSIYFLTKSVIKQRKAKIENESNNTNTSAK